MSVRTLRFGVSAFALIASFGFAGSALAQDAAPDSAAADSASEEGAIIVVAQKRAENIQKVPISMAAFNADALTKANVVSAQDLGRVATNVQVNKGVQSSFLRLNIRGIGSASNTTIEPSVAVFLDGVYIPRAGAIVGSMLDMESVEVLRGPQGTLFGRNASVGAFSLRSATPKDDLSGRMTAEIGNADRYKLDGYLNVPINENMGLRLAGMSQWFKGYWTNRLDGERYGGTDDVALRGSFKAEFGPAEWVLRADYSKISGDGFVNLDFDATSVSATQLAGLQARGLLPDTNVDDRLMNQYVTTDLDDEQWGVSSTLSFDIGGGSTLKLINSYRDWQSDQLDGDVIFTPVPILSRIGAYSSESQNHELQFISPEREWLNGYLDLVAGLYYFNEDYALSEKFQMNSQFCNVLTPAGPVRTACNAYRTATGGVDATDQEVTQTVNSYAAYGQATVHIIDTLNLTLGGRYTKDKKHGTYRQASSPFTQTLRATENLTLPDIDDSRFTYRISLNYQPNRDLMFFANLSTGYKSAGYNSGGGAPALSTFAANGSLISTKRVFARETSTNYELGAKTAWLDGALTANLTLYRMDINGYQDRAFDGTSFTVLNAGKLRQQGFEYDMVVSPMDGLKLFGSVAYLDSAFRSYPNAPGLPGLGGTQDLKGKPNTFSPEWTGRVAVDWTGDLGSSGMTLAINGNLSFVSDQYYGLVTDANPQTIQDGYALLGARVTLNGRDDRWSLAIFGNNLTNKQYTNGNLYQVLDGPLGLRNGVFPGSTAVRLLHADPRTYGASATYRF